MALPTNVAELYGDHSPADLAAKHERFLAALDNAPSTLKGDVAFNPQSDDGQMLTKVDRPADLLAKALDAPELMKGFDPQALASVNAALEQYKTQQADLQKDWTLSNPISAGLVAYDLRPGAMIMTPRMTPLRNRIPRTQGHGKAYQFKRITGFTGTGTGGVSAIRPGITDATQTNFANSGSSNTLYFNRGPKISYAGDDTTIPYLQFSVSDQVTWSAQYSGMGFQDIRALSKATLTYASMLLEERELLMGRGTASGFQGALSAPSGTPTGTATNVGTTGYAPITGMTTNVYVKVTADAGDFGQSTLSSASAGIAVSAGQYVTITIPNDVAGATGYRVYVSTGASDPGDTARWYAGRTGSNTFILQGALPTSGTAASTVTADTSASAGDYDGLLPVCLGSNSGYVKRLNAAFSQTNPGVEFQNAFVAMYNANKADPDEVFLNGADRKQLSDAIKLGGNNSDYRLTVQGSGDVTYGTVVTTIINEVTGKDVSLTVHPWLPQGNCPIVSWQLPYPDSSVGNLWEARNVQDYMGVDWPINQFSFDCSSYWYGTLVPYGPAWQGAVAGVLQQ